MKIKIILAAFVLLEALDAALSFFGIAVHGLSFEKNIFIRNLILSLGFFTIAAIKIAISIAFAVLISYFYDNYKNYRKFMIYLSVVLLLIALYGVGSSVYILVYP